MLVEYLFNIKKVPSSMTKNDESLSHKLYFSNYYVYCQNVDLKSMLENLI